MHQKHFEVKKWVRLKKKRQDITYQASPQQKEHVMIVKGFNRHKSNGGIATATTIDEIKTFKLRKGNGHRAKGGQVIHVENAVHLNHQENAQHGARNVTNVEIKTISVHVVGQSKRKRALRIARDNPMAGAP